MPKSLQGNSPNSGRPGPRNSSSPSTGGTNGGTGDARELWRLPRPLITIVSGAIFAAVINHPTTVLFMWLWFFYGLVLVVVDIGPKVKLLGTSPRRWLRKLLKR